MKEKEVESANMILGIPEKSEIFMVKWHGIRFYLSIRAITARGMILISREIAKTQDVEIERIDMNVEMIKKAENLKYICNAISIATGTRFRRFFSRVISELPLKDIHTLWKIILSKSDPQSFFFIMVSARGMSLLATTRDQSDVSGEETQSSAGSQ